MEVGRYAGDPKTLELIEKTLRAAGEWIGSDWPVCAVNATGAPHRMGAPTDHLLMIGEQRATTRNSRMQWSRGPRATGHRRRNFAWTAPTPLIPTSSTSQSAWSVTFGPRYRARKARSAFF